MKAGLHKREILHRPQVLDVALGAAIGGAASGAVISVGSTRRWDIQRKQTLADNILSLRTRQGLPRTARH